MNPNAIFEPMMAMVAWTFIIMLYMAYKRWGAGFAGRLKLNDFKMGESTDVPFDVRLAGRNFSNLFEAPVLFYVLCLSLFVTRTVSMDFLVIAWVYVALRVVHSLIHVSYNKVFHRFSVFAVSCFLLLAMWIMFAMSLYQRP